MQIFPCRSWKLFYRDDKWSEVGEGRGSVWVWSIICNIVLRPGYIEIPCESLCNTIQIIYPTNFVVKVKKKILVTVFKSLGHIRSVIDLSFHIKYNFYINSMVHSTVERIYIFCLLLWNSMTAWLPLYLWSIVKYSNKM